MKTTLPQLLNQSDFQHAVFSRDGHRCVFCDQSAVVAHSIIDSRLWPDGGYYVDNGASLCEKHRIECEKTHLSVEQVRDACGISRIVIPPHLYDDEVYDKWGNTILPNGTRLKGDLFFDPSVQEILSSAGLLGAFLDLVKYPRTPHLLWSEGLTKGDRFIDSMSSFEGKRVIVTTKMDGENTTMTRSKMHARSLDGASHPSQNWVRAFWGSICADIPEHWRICGENLYAKHSIEYSDLPSYFLGFSVWDEKNLCLDWDATMLWFSLLGITSVPVLYDGIYDENLIKSLWNPSQWDQSEGYVIRVADAFHYRDFRKCVAKFVRPNHVQTDQHWKTTKIMKNRLATG